MCEFWYYCVKQKHGEIDGILLMEYYGITESEK